MQLGLIGRKLGHSFSQKFFAEKWERQGIAGHTYELFELKSIDEFPALLRSHNLDGLNITVPYKEEILPFVSRLDESAEKVGAVNVLRIEGDNITGYNSDYYGFRQSLQTWLTKTPSNAFILGSGGASKAVQAVLSDLKIPFQTVSRTPSKMQIAYDELKLSDPEQAQLIVNTTPLGMHPSVESFPPIPYDQLHHQHFLYDLVYNPEVTVFMQKGIASNAAVKNGLEMLHLQAEKSWEIWTT